MKKKEKKCVICKKHPKYDSDGLCALCNYQRMLGIKLTPSI